MSEFTQTTQETMTDQKGQTPWQENDTFPTICGPGSSCSIPRKVGLARIVVMLIMIAVVVLSIIYR